MSGGTINKKKNLIKTVKITACVFIILLVILGVLFIFDKCFVDSGRFDFAKKKDDIYYFSADYNENISEDIVYMSYDRDIMFADASGFLHELTEDNIKDSLVAELMFNYFTALKNGDAASHAALFTEQYKRDFEMQERFTPQKVYDIEISYLTSNNGNDVYKVLYKIYENNGSYRADVGSNIAKIMAFEIDKSSGVALINSIGYISDK